MNRINGKIMNHFDKKEITVFISLKIFLMEFIKKIHDFSRNSFEKLSQYRLESKDVIFTNFVKIRRDFL